MVRPVPHASGGNRVDLLESGERFVAALLEAVEAARREVYVETYILGDDATGRRVLEALDRAAGRGVRVRLLVDGIGTGEFAQRVAARLAGSSARIRVYRPGRWWRPWRPQLRRLHRKIAVIDERVAFVGGINLNDEPQAGAGGGEALGPRLDFAVRCQGPIVASVAAAARRLWWAVGVASLGRLSERLPGRLAAAPPAAAGAVKAALVVRDNLRHRHSIERSYLRAIRSARGDVLIACAYFLPGRRFRRALRGAARRGVRVRLLLQGRVEYRLQHYAQRALYGQLLRAGIEIYEYRPSYLHGKVAVVDDRWATVGSSNIDPLSLLLAREANVVVEDRDFSVQLRSVIEQAIARDSRRFGLAEDGQRSWMVRSVDWLAYGMVRAATVLLARGNDY
jgi:cardiolipin synthase